MTEPSASSPRWADFEPVFPEDWAHEVSLHQAEQMLLALGFAPLRTGSWRKEGGEGLEVELHTHALWAHPAGVIASTVSKRLPEVGVPRAGETLHVTAWCQQDTGIQPYDAWANLIQGRPSSTDQLTVWLPDGSARVAHEWALPTGFGGLWEWAKQLRAMAQGHLLPFDRWDPSWYLHTDPVLWGVPPLAQDDAAAEDPEARINAAIDAWVVGVEPAALRRVLTHGLRQPGYRTAHQAGDPMPQVRPALLEEGLEPLGQYLQAAHAQAGQPYPSPADRQRLAQWALACDPHHPEWEVPSQPWAHTASQIMWPTLLLRSLLIDAAAEADPAQIIAQPNAERWKAWVRTAPQDAWERWMTQPDPLGLTGPMQLWEAVTQVEAFTTRWPEHNLSTETFQGLFATLAERDHPTTWVMDTPNGSLPQLTLNARVNAWMQGFLNASMPARWEQVQARTQALAAWARDRWGVDWEHQPLRGAVLLPRPPLTAPQVPPSVHLDMPAGAWTMDSVLQAWAAHNPVPVAFQAQWSADALANTLTASPAARRRPRL